MSVPAEMMPELPQEMSESEVLKAVDQEIRWADSLLQDDLSANRTRAWQYFEGGAPKILDEDIDEYFQTVVSRDVADTIESTLAEILPAFATDRPAEFDPLFPGDEDQAAMESDICNDILMEAGSGYLELMTAAKNALLLRIGALEVIWDERVSVEYARIQATPDMLAQLEMDPGVEIRRVLGQPMIDAAGGQALDIEVVRRVPNARCRVEAVPVDELLISSDATSLDLDETRFVARKKLISRSDLIAEGYPPEVVENLTAYTTTTSHRDRSARERNTWGREKHSGDRATDLIMTCRCYYRLDEDRDGIAELRMIMVAGTSGAWTIIDDEPVEFQPFAAGAAYLWPHMPYGISLYDKLRQVQDLKTKFWRIMLEAGTRNARDRVGILPGTNVDDCQETQFGGAVRMTSPQGVVPIPTQQFPASLAGLNEIADKARREGGGGATDKANQEAMPVEAGAHGVERMLTAIEELNGMVARLLAETLVRQAYLKIHETLRRHSPPFGRQMRGQWAQVEPGQWTARDKLSVATGLTLSERGRLSGTLGQLSQRMMELMGQGSTLVGPKNLYRVMADQLRMSGVRNVESYLVDPDSPEGQQAAQQAQQQAQQQAEQQKQAAMESLQAQGQMLAGVEQVKASGRLQAEQLKAQADLRELTMKLQAEQREAMLKFQAENREAAGKMALEQRKLAETIAAQYDGLRVKIAEIEARYGESGAELTGETP